MANEGEFPKSNGDIFYGKDANMCYQHLIDSDTTQTTNGTTTNAWVNLKSYSIAADEVKNFIWIVVHLRSDANDNLGESVKFRIQVDNVDVIPEFNAISHTSGAGHGLSNKYIFLCVPFVPSSAQKTNGFTIDIDGYSTAASKAVYKRSYIVGA